MNTPVNVAQLNQDAILARLDALSAQVEQLVTAQKKQAELYDELIAPVGKEVLGSAARAFEKLEKKGVFAFSQALLEVGERVIESYSPEDVRALGGAVTTILDTVRALTQPEVLSVASDASAVLQQADRTQPIGLLGMVRATSDQDVGRGIALMFEVMRRVGKGAKAVAEKSAATTRSSREKVNALLAPKRRALGTERPPPRAIPAVNVVKAPAAAAGPACAAPAKPAATAVVLDGISFSADGHLTDSTQWTQELAVTLAQAQGVVLTDAHWKVLEGARADFLATKASPNIRRLTQVMGVATKDLYALFPKAPGRTIAKVAGLPKPTGCL